MTLSRREFLQSLGLTATGASLFGVALPSITSATSPTIPNTTPPQVIQGRVLQPAHIENLRTSQTIRSLLPDEVVPIHAENDLFYGTDGGSVLRQHIQPIQPYPADIAPPNTFPIPSCLEVAAPATTLHTYAAPNAPLKTRLGHGAVMQVTDTIENQYGRWYNISDAANSGRGWSQALHWRLLPELSRPSSTTIQHLQLNRHTRRLTAYIAQKPVFSTPVRFPQKLTTDSFTLTPIGRISLPQLINGHPRGISYRFQLQSNSATQHTYTAHAAYWHNDFHLPADQTSYAPQNIEFNTLAGKWLYKWTSQSTSVTVM